MKKPKSRNRGPTHVCLEVTKTSLHLAIYRPAESENRIRTRTIRWQQEADGLTFEYGPQELSSALLTLVYEEGLLDAEFQIALGGEYCITRHVSGTKREVMERISELENQCRRFLLLGQGQKLAASTIVETSSGDFRGVISVFNRQVLQVILEAAGRMGVTVKEVNSSAVLMAGLVHEMCDDSEGGLIIRLQDDRVDLFVVDQGFPLLDVRPVQRLGVDDLGKFVADRRALLDRFYGSHSLTARRELNVVYVSGEAENPAVRKQLLDLGLSVQVLSHELEATGWGFAAETDLTNCTSPLGAFCGLLPRTEAGNHPDLLSVLAGTETESLQTRLVQTLWPLVAAALLCMMLQTMGNAERKVARHFDKAVALFEQTQEQIDELEYRVRDLSQESLLLTQIKKQADEAEWDGLVSHIAACMPVDCSLVAWVVNNDGSVQLRGRCSREESVYQFVEYVGRLPEIRRAALAGTKTTTGFDLGAVEFDVVVELRPVATATRLVDAKPGGISF